MALSFMHTLVLVATSPQHPDDVMNPLPIAYRLFLEGRFDTYLSIPRQIPIDKQTMLTYGSFNLGELIGLSGPLSFVPWLIIVAILTWLLLHNKA